MDHKAVQYIFERYERLLHYGTQEQQARAEHLQGRFCFMYDFRLSLYRYFYNENRGCLCLAGSCEKGTCYHFERTAGSTPPVVLASALGWISARGKLNP